MTPNRALSGDVNRNYSDISKAKRMLGFSPEFDLDRGLRNTFEYFRQKKQIFNR